MADSGGNIERVIDYGVAALFAIACAFPAFMLLPDFGQPALAVAGTIGMLAFVVAVQVLGRVERRPRPAVEFDLMALPEFPEVEPLELDAADRLAAQPSAGTESQADALELDDWLPAVGPGSRVVRLFGDPAQATAGELAVRIERHLARRSPVAAVQPPDASGELFDALNELRRSLR